MNKNLTKHTKVLIIGLLQKDLVKFLEDKQCNITIIDELNLRNYNSVIKKDIILLNEEEMKNMNIYKFFDVIIIRMTN